MSQLLAPGYRIRAPRVDDAVAVHALIAASDIADFGESHYALADLQDDWRDFDLARDAWVVVGPSDTAAGYCYIRDRQHVRMDVEGYVHPDHFDRGIGTTLIRTSEARAREHVSLAPPEAQVVVNNWVNAQNADACALLEREGYTPARYFFQMEATLDDVPPTPTWPANVGAQPLTLGEQEHAFYTTVEEAMAHHWGHVPIPFETWKQRRMGGNFDPSLWFLALDNGESAGAILCSVSEGIGWVDVLAVRKEWRRRGLGMALLHHAAGEFHRRGLQRMALGVDTANLSGATRLYERAGMHVGQQHATFAKELRSGDELTDPENAQGS